MGKVRLDPMFMDLNKRVGNFVHSKWKGQQIIRAHNPERRDSTSAQLEVQNAFKITAGIWRNLPEVIKLSWKPYIAGKPLTELNLFIKENANRQRLGTPYILTKGNGIEKLNGIVVDTSIPGQITIDFDMPVSTVNLSVILQGIADSAGTSELIIKPDVYTGTKPVQITGLVSGAEYYMYCFVTDDVFNESVQISESTGFQVTVA